jgi:hypothetical protein
VGPQSRRKTGVEASRASATLANALTIKDTGATTRFFPLPSAQVVRMLSESLPTGIDTPRAGQSSIPTAWTAS